MSKSILSDTKHLLAAVLAVLCGVLFAIGFASKPAEAQTTCGSLQTRVNNAASGATVDLPDGCVYREQVTITKPLTLQGGPGVEIRGSNVWTGWTSSGGYWKSSNTLPSFPQTNTSIKCLPNTSRCLWPEQVFIGGNALRQVASNPTTGQFAVDSGRHVVLKDDPRGKTVEVSVRRHWVLGTSTADNVTIQGFTMKHAANEAQSGAIMNRPSRLEGGGSNWTVQNNKLSDVHGDILSFNNGTGFKILNNDIFRAGQLGIHMLADGGVVSGNKVHDNNTEDFDYRWEAGGMKFHSVQNTVVNSNQVYNNKGNAIQFDYDGSNNTISNNRVYNNARKGIQYELSTYGKIFGNVLWENGWATPDRNDGAGITLQNASNTEVYNNTLAWNADGIAVFALDRDGTTWDRVHDVYVHDNTILGKNSTTEDKNHVALAWLAWSMTSLFDPANNNRGVNNKYWYTSAESTLTRFVWNQTNYPKLSSFNATRGEEGGRYLTQSEKDALVSSKGIPANPVPR